LEFKPTAGRESNLLLFVLEIASVITPELHLVRCGKWRPGRERFPAAAPIRLPIIRKNGCAARVRRALARVAPYPPGLLSTAKDL